MSLLLTLLVLLCGILALVTALSKRQQVGQRPSSLEQQPTAPLAYRRQKALFTPTEKAFYRALHTALDNQFIILGKVRVADILQPQQASSRSQWQRAFNKISAKHFDFVLCDRDSLDVIAALELDDSSHRQAKRTQRDNFLNQAASSAGLLLIRFPARKTYSPADLQSTLQQKLPK